MNLKGKQLKRVRRYRSADPLQRKVARFKHEMSRLRTPIGCGVRVYFDMNKQMTQPLPETIDVEAWGREFDAMALCNIFGVPYELYESSQMHKL